MAIEFVSMSAEDLKRLKEAYKQSSEAGDTSFMFMGRTWDIGYAKYVIEYLEGQFK